MAPEELDRLRPPSTVDALGLPRGLAEDLFLRRVLTDRTTTIGETASQLCVAHGVAVELAESLREKAQLEYLGVAGRDYRIQLTELGHRTTTQRMSSGLHVGAMPLPRDLYELVVRAQRPELTVDRGVMANAFRDLIVDDRLLDQIGPAFLSDGAIFLYGPAGTGKTSVAERLNRIFTDPVLIPRYMETDGQIISVYDPALHQAIEPQPQGVDPRWVLCERPLIIVGGELDLGMLDLRYDRVSGVSTAPIQMLANNGVLVVDDFGRQSARPEELLNRWIVPLSRGVDYLMASTGSKFTVPFEVKLVLSTNLDPNSLGDDAFLRRLRNKVYIGAVDRQAFVEILYQVVVAYDLAITEDAPAHLAAVARDHVGELRPYLPVDFCQLALAIADYEGAERVLDPDMIERIAELYFVQREDDQLPDRSPASEISRPGPSQGVEPGAGVGYGDPRTGPDALAANQVVGHGHPADDALAAPTSGVTSG